MTDRFKDVLSAFRRFYPVYNEDGELGQIDAYQLFTKEEFETIVYGLTLATEAEQLRKENEELKAKLDVIMNWLIKLFSQTSIFAVPPECKHRFVRVNFNTAIDGEHPVCADCGKKIENCIVKVNNKSSQKEGFHGSCF